jgi:two-component system NtrC family sensor kinase/two-component system sensor histidine kinase AtoS
MAISYYAHSKEITFKFPEQKFILNADKELLDMLFSNFIVNAIDAIELDEEEEGTIEIVYNSDEAFHIFRIYDTGVAIVDKRELFEAFRSTKVKGNGLGLVLSRQIAEAHGGSVCLLDTQKKGFEIKIALS